VPAIYLLLARDHRAHEATAQMPVGAAIEPAP